MIMPLRTLALRLAIAGLVGACAAAGVALLQPRTFESTTEFVPVSASQSSRLERLAGTLGIGALGAMGGGQSPDFYVHLLDTEQMFRSLIAACAEPVAVEGCTTRVHHRLTDEMQTAADSAAAIRELRKRMGVGAGQNSGVVQVRVRMKSPQDAQAVGLRTLEWLNDFNLRQRASTARAERAFLEERSKDALEELAAAESRLTNFSLRNRDFRSSPQLQLQAERLQREVTLHQTTYTEVRTALEQSRVDEVRDTPLITVVQEPTIPLRPLSRQVLFWAIAGAAVAAAVLIVVSRSTRAAVISHARSTFAIDPHTQ